MDPKAEADCIRLEIARLTENYEFLVRYYRERISEKQDELDILRRTKRRMNTN
jgi:hypothetical protein